MNAAKVLGTIGAVILIIALFAGVGWMFGSRNPETPAGYVGYLTQGAVFGKAQFIGLQTGPTSPGRTWMADVVNVSVTPYTTSEDFATTESVLSKDNLKISFRVHIVWRVNPDRVKDFVERYSTLHEGIEPNKVVMVAYDNFLKEPLRTYARDEIQQLNSLEIKDRITPTGQSIYDRIMKLTKDTPFQVISVVVGNVQYPEAVANAVAEKLAATQVLERMQTEIAIEEKKKQKRVIEAQGIAESMNIINQKLSPLYIQHEAIEAQKMMVGSPNHTTIYIPVGPNGVPVVGTFDTTPPKDKDK